MRCAFGIVCRVALGFLTPLSTTAVAQQPPCAERAAVVKKLLDRYGETQRTTGLQYDGEEPQSAFETFANDETGTWTILRSTPDGMTCFFAAGKDWNDVPIPTKPGDPA